MNKLMRFNPEPFDTEFEAETSFGVAAEGETFELEQEMRGRGGRSRLSGSRAPQSAHRPAKARSNAQANKPAYGQYSGRSNPSSSQMPWPKGRHSGRWGYPDRWGYPVGVAAWPESDAPAANASALPSEHVSWVQTALNGALGLRLPVTGVMNAQTRSAVRMFQERRGLPINGSVGPETESALRGTDAATAPPPAPAAEPPPGPAPAGDTGQSEWEIDPYHVLARVARDSGPIPAAPVKSVKALRNAIVRIAEQEAVRWKNGAIQELDPKIRAVLMDYWKAGPGLSFTAAQIGSKAFQALHPWSAAFISWVMRKAGAGKSFKYAASHSVYISAAKANRIADNANPFKAYRLNEVAPRVGDLICRSRAGSGATYDNIHPGMTTHCDIVIAVKPGAVTVIGGNVGNSVKRRIVHTDNLGRVIEPLVFAVIRVGTHKPRMPASVPPVPGPPPGPAPVIPTGPAPKLLKQETSPPSATLYPQIDLGIVDRFKLRAAPMTGIFLPEGFTPGPLVDVILYLHGHKAASVRDLTIDQYWNRMRFHYGALREKLNEAGRNTVLVAPTLGAYSEAGNLLDPGGLDGFIAKVLASLGASGPNARGGVGPSLRNLIFACHSGGGLPMRKLAGGSDKALTSLRECWGFDCTYNHGDDTFWADWARKTPSVKCYFYYIKGSQTAALSESLRDKRIPNAIVQPAGDGRHNYVPITHWLERIQGAPMDEPADIKRLSHPAFIDFVGVRARKAMAATGVPASVTVAQAILETGWGKHTIGSAKNLFGIKGKGPAGSVRVPTREFLNGAWVTIEANFAKYDSFEQSISEHARFFLKNKRYAAALKAKDDADSFAREIHKAGYATGPDYADQLIKLMKRYDLYRFDR
jgi:Mannosyl-glycoprotein endo-beta-N-acetylglucosaminidase/Uncharacterized protein conserved in bacteria (DUF2272)/Putative peptidoglycan binding domain